MSLMKLCILVYIMIIVSIVMADIELRTINPHIGNATLHIGLFFLNLFNLKLLLGCRQ
jgi:hypothetical protein